MVLFGKTAEEREREAYSQWMYMCTCGCGLCSPLSKWVFTSLDLWSAMVEGSVLAFDRHALPRCQRAFESPSIADTTPLHFNRD